ncbi:MAG TPA: hypothetical protein EYH39_03000, partial [Desulfurobacteriaceae bacterium]|nr:hypothetical protein [Desulfurobacteriaceae bacterium]
MDCKDITKNDKSCPYLKECPIFATYIDPNDKKCMKILKTYCYSEYDRCARYKLKLDNKKVPINLLPDGSYIKTTSLRKNLFVAISAILFFVSAINFGIFYYQLNNFSKELQNSIFQYAIKVKKEELKKKTDIVFSIINKIYQENKDKLPPQKLKELIKETVR